VGIFQRKHDPLAMLYSAFFGLLLLGAFAAVFLYAIRKSIAEGKTGWADVALMFGMTLIMLGGASCILTGPLRVLLVAWRWRRQGVNLAALEKEIHGRA
jgi:uncharacterized membrane protein